MFEPVFLIAWFVFGVIWFLAFYLQQPFKGAPWQFTTTVAVISILAGGLGVIPTLFFTVYAGVNSRTEYYLEGGVYAGLDWAATPTTELKYGPFTKAEATRKWGELMWANVDNAEYRLTIQQKHVVDVWKFLKEK